MLRKILVSTRCSIAAFIDTVEVCGSSPHGPTILLNNLRTRFRRYSSVCVVVSDIPPQRTFTAQSVEGLPLGIESNVGIMRKHLGRDVPCNCHNGLVARLRFRYLCDCMMAKVMKA